MKKSGIIFITVFAIFLELLPYGAVLIFAPSPVDTIKETYSYFSLVPVGYANSAPFVTAILTCILLALQIAEIITNNRFIRKIIWLVSLGAVITSLAPVLFGFDYYTLTGGFITVVLIIECFFIKMLPKNI